MNQFRKWTALWCIMGLAVSFGSSISRIHAQSNFLTTIYSEDFESVQLGPNVDEGVAGDEVWAKNLDGWEHDDSGVPGVGNPDQDGITEWAGWSFAKKDWWVETAGDQGRSAFTAGQGTVALADGDEWDDAESRAPGNQTTYLITPEIEIGQAVPGSLRIAFDSSYAADGNQESGTVDASYDGGATWNQILLWTRANTPSDKNYESVSIRANNPVNAKSVQFRFGYINAGNNWWFAIDNIEVQVVRPTVLFSEDFEDVELGPNVDEGVAGDNVWAKNGPEGWNIDDSGVPGVGNPDEDGITEWAGWSFASKDWWVETAGDQGRSAFTAGMGTVALADGDEWDDAESRAPGNQTTFLMTPSIDISSITPNSLEISFDSSYAADGSQESGTVDVSYDDGATWEEILLWTRANTPNDKNYDSVSIKASNPAGATTAKFRFGYINAGNNWWFAIDNIVVFGSEPFWTEDFEGVVLGPNVDEGVAGDNVWAKEGPDGWTIDDSGVPGAGNPEEDGITEWAGWSFANKDWWVETAGDQGRSAFTAGMGTVALADGDEWDDAESRAPGNQTTFLSTPDVDISGLGTSALSLFADTSYAADGSQESGNVEVSFDKGETWSEILLWTRANTPNDKNYESIALTTPVPAGAETVRYKFGYIDAGNNWWFAIDNLALAGVDEVEPSISPVSPGDGDSQVSPAAQIVFEVDPGTTGIDTIKLINMADGSELALTTETDEDGVVTATHTPTSNFAFGEVVMVKMMVTSGKGTEITEDVSFEIDSPFLMTSDFILNIDKDDRGFLLLTKVNSTQTSNTHQRAEDQLANRILNNFGDPINNDADDSNADDTLEFRDEIYLIENDVINYNQDSTAENSVSIGEVGGDGPIPGVPQGLNNGIAMEFYTYLELEPGYYVMGFNSDDGFKITVGPEFRSLSAPIVGEFEGGRGAATTSFSILVEEAGLYPFRGIWYEGSGGANLEWWHVGPNGERILINDDSNPNAIKAFLPPTPENPNPIIVGTTPSANLSNVAANTAIIIEFSDGGVNALNQDEVTITVTGRGTSNLNLVEDEETGILRGTWTPDDLFSAGQPVEVTIEYTFGSGDNKKTRSINYSFDPSDYPTVNTPASNPDGNIGFNYRLHQIASESFEEPIILPNSIGRAEVQLAGILPYPNLAWSEADGEDPLEVLVLPDLEDPTASIFEGFFQDTSEFPEIPGFAVFSLVDTPSIAMELTGFIELPEGYTRFGINRAGGVRVTIGGNPEVGSNPASVFDSFEWASGIPGDGYIESQFDVLAEKAGVYPIRVVYFQGSSPTASFGFEFYSVTSTGERILINDSENDDSIKVYQNADLTLDPFIEALSPTPIDPSYISEGVVGILLNPGSSSLDRSKVGVILNGEEVPSSRLDIEEVDGGRLLVTVEATGFVLPEAYHGIIVTYGDDSSEMTDRWVFQGLTNDGDVDPVTLFSENFDSAELMPNVDESVEEDNAWTREFEGWTVDNSGVPGVDSPDADGDGFGDNDGVTEWAGWTFANIEFWQKVDSQRRSEFTNASGVVLVADPDEWDDLPHANSAENGWFQTTVEMPSVDISGDKTIPNGLFLEFDSSWRPECDSNYRQSARVWVQFDDQPAQRVLLWTSCPGPFFKDDNSTNEHILIPLFNPEGASSVKVTFEMFDAGNDWWWAIDNVELRTTTDQAPVRTECQALELAGLPCTPIGGGEVGSLSVSSDGTNITVSWPEGTASNYQVQKRTAFGPGTSWENVGSPTTEKTFTEAADGTEAFYRVIIAQ